MPSRPEVTCGPGDLHVAETPRMWVVTSRTGDFYRWVRVMADDPDGSPDWPARDLQRAQRIPLDPIADPVDSPQELMPVDPNQLFFAGIDRETDHLVSGLMVNSTSGESEIGGAVHVDYRGQGYGREMMAAVCGLVHRHFGIARLVAGCEETNTASRAWLAGAGFRLTSGPSPHKLPNGRVMQALWWEHVDAEPELWCPRPRPRSKRRLFRRR